MTINPIILVKIGGSVAKSSDILLSLVSTLCDIIQEGRKVIMVHGGGAEISRNLKLINQKPLFLEGLRVTKADDLKMVEMTLSGYVNKMLVSLFQKQGRMFGLNAVGISGVDAFTFICKPISKDLGQVGKIVNVNPGLINCILDLGMVPVVSPISTDRNGVHFNVNADEAARALAMALKVEKLIFISDVPGVLGKDGNTIPNLTSSQIKNLEEDGVINGGMLPKLKACVEVASSGVGEVHICSWKDGPTFQRQLMSLRNTGTIIS